MNTAGGPCDGSSCWRRAPLEVRDARCVTGSWQRCAVERQVLELFEGCRALHGCLARQVFRYLPSDDEMSMRLRRSLSRILIWTVSRSVSMDCLALMERPLLVKRWSSAGREHLDTIQTFRRCAERYDSFSLCQRYGTSWSVVAGRWSSSCAGSRQRRGNLLEVDGLSARESHNWNFFFFFAATQRLRSVTSQSRRRCRPHQPTSWQ